MLTKRSESKSYGISGTMSYDNREALRRVGVSFVRVNVDNVPDGTVFLLEVGIRDYEMLKAINAIKPD